MFGIVFWSLMMEAVRTSETSVDNHFTRQYIPEDNFGVVTCGRTRTDRQTDRQGDGSKHILWLSVTNTSIKAKNRFISPIYGGVYLGISGTRFKRQLSSLQIKSPSGGTGLARSSLVLLNHAKCVRQEIAQWLHYFEGIVHDLTTLCVNQVGKQVMTQSCETVGWREIQRK
jgi:hypothetical protein